MMGINKRYKELVFPGTVQINLFCSISLQCMLLLDATPSGWCVCVHTCMFVFQCVKGRGRQTVCVYVSLWINRNQAWQSPMSEEFLWVNLSRWKQYKEGRRATFRDAPTHTHSHTSTAPYLFNCTLIETLVTLLHWSTLSRFSTREILSRVVTFMNKPNVINGTLTIDSCALNTFLLFLE